MDPELDAEFDAQEIAAELRAAIERRKIVEHDDGTGSASLSIEDLAQIAVGDTTLLIAMVESIVHLRHRVADLEGALAGDED